MAILRKSVLKIFDQLKVQASDLCIQPFSKSVGLRVPLPPEETARKYVEGRYPVLLIGTSQDSDLRGSSIFRSGTKVIEQTGLIVHTTD
jgi:hypothetical protein